LNKLKNQPPNTSRRQLEEITGVPKSTIARVIQEKLHDECTLRHGQQGTSQKPKREGKDPDVEEAISIVTG
jgi:predicted HTH transcriptional regulator